MSNWELAPILLGLALIIVEFYTMLTGGMLGVVGGLLLAVGLFSGLIPADVTWDLSDPRVMPALSYAATQTTVAFVVIGFGAMALVAALPRLANNKNLSVQAEITATSAGSFELEADAIIGKSSPPALTYGPLAAF